MEIKCPHCGANYEVTESELGTKADCLECGRTFVVGQRDAHSNVNKQIRIKSTASKYPPMMQVSQMTNTTNVSTGGFFSLKGRARRSEWWKVSILTGLVGLVLGFILVSILEGASDDIRPKTALTCLFLLVAIVALIIIRIPVGVRRLHDRNISGWWILMFIVGYFVPIIDSFVGIVEVIILGCLDGTLGDNNYGSDPKRRRTSLPVVGSPQPAVRVTESPEDSLLKLVKLKDAGVLTDEEYEIRRMKLVARMDE